MVVAKAGDERTYKTCRFKVRKGWKTPDGSGGAYDPVVKELRVVWVEEEQGYRSISLENITRIALGGNVYIVKQE